MSARRWRRARRRSSPSAGRQIPNAAFVRVADARAALAQAAARFYPRQPETIVAVTGTSGKTSVVAFARQIWQALGFDAASLGTIGVVSRPLTVYGSLTTPDPIALHELLDGSPGAASRISRWRPPRTASIRSGSTACASPPARSPICRATTWTTTQPSRTIWRPSSGCSVSSCRPARRPSSTPTATSRRASSRLRGRAGSRCSRSA